LTDGDKRRDLDGGGGGGGGGGTRFTCLRSDNFVFFFFFFCRRRTEESLLLLPPLLLPLRDVSTFPEADGRTSSAADLEQSKAKKTNLKMLFRKSTTKWFQSL
jgi:hypothetical protein